MKIAGIIIFGFLAMWGDPAHAQVSGGTVVVFQRTQSEFVIAADSRATNPKKSPVDTYCKIVALDRQFVFALTGGADYDSGGLGDFAMSWSATQEAKTVAQFRLGSLNSSQNPTEIVDGIAAEWADAIKNDWQNLYAFHPEQVTEQSSATNGMLTFGIFVFAKDGKIILTNRLIKFDNPNFEILTANADCETYSCAMGEGNLVDAYIKSKTQFTFDPKLLSRASPELLTAVHLVDIAIATDPTERVGGPIDALELFNDGTIRWFSRKDNCPAQ